MTQVACLLYPGITALDVVGPLQVFSALGRMDAEVEVVTVAAHREAMTTDTPLDLTASHDLDSVPRPDVLLVPGGMQGTLHALQDRSLIDYIAQAGSTATYATSVCTGSLLLGAAGLLDGRRATSHWIYRHLLANYGARPASARWVRDGPVVTSAGVSAGIDMAFDLLLELTDHASAVRVHQMLEYDPAPPITAEAWWFPAPEVNEQRCRELVEAAMPDGAARRRLLGHES